MTKCLILQKCVAPKKMNKLKLIKTHSGFETQRRRHQKSKTVVSVAPQKGLRSMSSKNVSQKTALFIKVSDGVHLRHVKNVNFMCATK